MHITLPHIRSQKLRPYVLPFAILLGFLFHDFFAKINAYSIYILFLILFLTFCDMDFKQIRIRPLHLWLMGFQFILGIAFYFALSPFSEILAEGAMMGMFAPVAVSATVVAVVLGANMATMVTYTILYNIALAFIAPICFSLINSSEAIPFWTSVWIIIRKVFPLILFPLILAFFFQKVLPKATKVIVRSKMLPFYLWALALTTVIGQTIDYIMEQESSQRFLIWIMVAIAMAECFLQFGFGRWIGRKYGDVIAGGQACGQKNGVLAVWMTQTYLNPLASVVPAAYVIFQNLWNSWQMFALNNRKKSGNKNVFKVSAVPLEGGAPSNKLDAVNSGESSKSKVAGVDNKNVL